jgi:hypothetical protein
MLTKKWIMLQFVHMPELGQLFHPYKINSLSYNQLRGVKITDKSKASAGLN